MLEIFSNETSVRVELLRGFASPVEMPAVRGRSRWSGDGFDVRLRQYLLTASRVPVSRGVGQRLPRFTHASRHFGL